MVSLRAWGRKVSSSKLTAPEKLKSFAAGLARLSPIIIIIGGARGGGRPSLLYLPSLLYVIPTPTSPEHDVKLPYPTGTQTI
jgi:hypothetical protein